MCSVTASPQIRQALAALVRIEHANGSCVRAGGACSREIRTTRAAARLIRSIGAVSNAVTQEAAQHTVRGVRAATSSRGTARTSAAPRLDAFRGPVGTMTPQRRTTRHTCSGQMSPVLPLIAADACSLVRWVQAAVPIAAPDPAVPPVSIATLATERVPTHLSRPVPGQTAGSQPVSQLRVGQRPASWRRAANPCPPRHPQPRPNGSQPTTDEPA
jgi:hypothetical protein